MVKGILGFEVRLHVVLNLWLRIPLLLVGLVLWVRWLLIGGLLVSGCVLLVWNGSVGREVKRRLLGL